MEDMEAVVRVPGLNHVPEEWVEELLRAAQWVVAGVSGPEDSGTLRCGVIQGNPASRWMTALPSVLWDNITKLQPGAQVICASAEKCVDQLDALQPSSNAVGSRPKLQVETYRSACAWIRSQGLSTAEGGGCRQVVFVLDVDSTYSAAFAVTLLTIVTWGRWAAARKMAPKRVVVILVSLGPVDAAVRSVLDEAHGGNLMDFELAELDEDEEQLNFVPLGKPELGDALRHIAARATEGERHCIMLCGNAASFAELTEEEGISLEILAEEYNSQAPDKLACGDRRTVVVDLCRRFHAPLIVQGFTHLHLVTDAGHDYVKAHDFRTGQIVDMNLYMPADELAEQLSWAFRTDCPRDKVTIYLDVTEPRLQPERRRLFNDRQMEGMLAGLSFLDKWLGGTGSNALRPLIKACPTAALDSMMRMANMGLIKVNLAEMSMTECLERPLRRRFHDLLRLFDYDPRLALFVALPSKSTAVNSVKIQFAALQMEGGANMFWVLDPGSACDGALVDACAGYTKGFATTGTVWALLGFWKMAMKRSRGFEGGVESLELIPGRVEIPAARAWAMATRVGDIEGILRRHCPDWVDVLSFVAEPDRMDKADVDELRQHLLRCYSSQIAAAVVPKPPADDQGGSEHLVVTQYQDLASRALFRSVVGLEGLVDFQAITQSDSREKVPFGVYVNLSRPSSHADTQVKDWIWIPHNTWASWTPGCLPPGSTSDHGVRLGQILGRTAPFQVNVDEVGL
ncbi:hypothetical protein PLIIFM63780_003384 [Purpureocillium lilacinum]|nr:hypothetical protein PLIIFM63780_003384 [Purpureocillium lilacinum]